MKNSDISYLEKQFDTARNLLAIIGCVYVSYRIYKIYKWLKKKQDAHSNKNGKDYIEVEYEIVN